MKESIWPKVIPALTPEQKAISDDFMRYWHEVLPKRFSLLDDFNHGYAVKEAPEYFTTTLELGAGLGTHLQYERLTPEQERNYVALELRENMAEKIRARFPQQAPAMEFKDALQVRRNGRELELVANGGGAAIMEQLRARNPESLTSEALTLEEVFVATLK